MIYHCLNSLCEPADRKNALDFAVAQCSPYVHISGEEKPPLLRNVHFHAQHELRSMYGQQSGSVRHPAPTIKPKDDHFFAEPYTTNARRTTTIQPSKTTLATITRRDWGASAPEALETTSLKVTSDWMTPSAPVPGMIHSNHVSNTLPYFGV